MAGTAVWQFCTKAYSKRREHAGVSEPCSARLHFIGFRTSGRIPA